MNQKEMIFKAKEILAIEARAIGEVAERIGPSFCDAIELILCRVDPKRENSGRLVVIGVGKSGLVGKKMAATFASTGTPSFFIHPTEALHGDLGMVSPRDIVLALSNSGEAEELVRVASVLKQKEISLIVMTGNIQSTLAGCGDLVLDVQVNREACPLGLAPTSSTTATMALGDALALVLMERRGFNRDDYAALHPGGKLGDRLRRVAEVMIRGDQIPRVLDTAPLREILYEISSKRLGMTAVINEHEESVGIITDGDIRRWLEKKGSIEALASEVMTSSPKSISSDIYATDALEIMESFSITALLVAHPTHLKKIIGVVHIHDLLSHAKKHAKVAFSY